ncbi:hypothetical protein [Cryptosporangium sp. NPDC048952]|uniref:hypothetical protein n=1 Tax=Cryptosporangium sp. NPDC048952 TaxID=3363961 RepID=UPI003712F22B
MDMILLRADNPRFMSRAARLSRGKSVRRGGTSALAAASLVMSVPLLVFFGWSAVVGIVVTVLLVAWLMSMGRIAFDREQP